ncbi:vacuolar sorting protein, putative [Ichthyophthirius multifiliis]|uniref:Vacuolar sorting protein, putative n=1 Tax=Ichthyophthirius multifiliis TaxID=5932 RepID=G0QVV3_ICHMU|nr:vacuolar sorting protein, putative [Ichthyophthirius multifiliis]EGR30648.1 vacuolar sorting protein, putative [Ichthyophthirius multifiliis]|eukprot:XP_004032235.1 vacuolar sorting protein, putative [Ichthyophthirius multifiliis]
MQESKFESKDYYIQIETEYYQIQNLAIIQDAFQFNLDERLVSIAKFGGPIAIYQNPSRRDLFKQTDLTKENICFYANNGDLINKCQFKCENNQIIVGFDFSEDELLVILLQNGIYFLIDPFINSIKPIKNLLQIHFLKMMKFKVVKQLLKFLIYLKQKIKIQDNSMAYFTKSQTFYLINDIKNPQTDKIIQINEQIKPQKWIFLKTELIFYNQNEIQNYKINNNNNNTDNNKNNIQIIQKNINVYLMQSFQRKIFAFLQLNEREQQWIINVYEIENQTQQYQIIVQNMYILYKKQQQNIEEDQIQNLLIQLFFINETTILINIQKTGFFLIPLKSQTQKYLASQESYVFLQEIDGLKLLTESQNLILRKVPQSHVNIFEPISIHPAALLFEAFQSLQNKDPLNDEDIRNDNQSLFIAVLDCIEASKYEIGIQEQALLLKAASYGKMFLQCGRENKQENIQIGEVCKILRILNALRSQFFHRTMTYYQFKGLQQENLVKILMRYNLHYLASEIIQFLKFHESLQSLVHLHWAGEKVQDEKISNEVLLAEKIYKKTQFIKDIQYFEIAQKALDVGKVNLAVKLLDYEKNLEKKVEVLVWIFENNSL